MDIASILDTDIREIRQDLSWDEYRESPGISPSTIAYGKQSMMALKYAWDTPRKDTDDFLWGRSMHTLLFEPDEFEGRYSVWDGARRYGKAWDEFMEEARAAGRDVLTTAQWDSALLAAESFVGKPRVQEIINSGQPEVAVYWCEDGVQCRGRLDWVNRCGPERVIVDLKTTKSLDSRSFGRDFFNYAYDLKLGLYQRWMQLLTGESWRVAVVALEKKEPYDVTVLNIPDSVLERGAERGLAILSEVKECCQTGTWPGRDCGTGESVLWVPSWEMEEELVEFEG